MSTITVSIIRSNIYSIAEGISISIAQHNGGTPTYEQLWASADESRKLDIYYREAISDLERHLTEWIKESSAQFNLTANGDNYNLQLGMNRYWPVRLQGLLANKIQDYLVHAVTAGWLNDFEGLSVKQDYQAMAGQDITDIRNIIEVRDFNFADSQRTDDGDSKDDSGTLTPGTRQDDGDSKDDSGTLTPGTRQADKEKDGPVLKAEAGYRKKDNITKLDNNNIPPYCRPKNLRHRDNAIVDTSDDWTDWSGTGIAYRDSLGYDPNMHMLPIPPCERPAPLPMAGCTVKQESCRVAHGQGYTPSRFDNRKPAPAPCNPSPATCGLPTGQHPTPAPVGSPNGQHRPSVDPRMPDNPTHPNYPPIYADGKGWSDDALYDEKGSEHYINKEPH